jgi:hypothetical protein
VYHVLTTAADVICQPMKVCCFQHYFVSGLNRESDYLSEATIHLVVLTQPAGVVTGLKNFVSELPFPIVGGSDVSVVAVPAPVVSLPPSLPSFVHPLVIYVVLSLETGARLGGRVDR